MIDQEVKNRTLLDLHIHPSSEARETKIFHMSALTAGQYIPPGFG